MEDLYSVDRVAERDELHEMVRRARQEALAPSESTANRALRDGSLLANIKHATWNHAQFTELLSVVSAKAAAMRGLSGMDQVSEYLDEAADAMDDVRVAS